MIKKIWNEIKWIFISIYKTLQSIIWFYFSILITRTAIFSYTDILEQEIKPILYYNIIQYLDILEMLVFKVIIWLLLVYKLDKHKYLRSLNSTKTEGDNNEL